MPKQLKKIVALLLALVSTFLLADLVLFPGGFPRDLPFVRWKAQSDSYVYNLLPRPPKQMDEYRVCLIGNSLIEKGVHAPTLQRILSDRLSRPCTVYNYGIPSSYVCDYLLSVQRAELAKPDLLIVGTSWRDLAGDSEVDPKKTAVYQLLYAQHERLPGFLKRTRYEEIADYELGKLWSLYRYRRWIRINSGALMNALIEPNREKNPQFFEMAEKVDWSRLRRLVKAQYENSERVYPNKQTECLQRLLLAAPSYQILVVNLPVSSLWFKEDPDTMQDDAWDYIQKEVEQAGARQLDASSLCKDNFFIDSRHLGKQGSLYFTKWLADKILNVEGSH